MELLTSCWQYLRKIVCGFFVFCELRNRTLSSSSILALLLQSFDNTVFITLRSTAHFETFRDHCSFFLGFWLRFRNIGYWFVLYHEVKYCHFQKNTMPLAIAGSGEFLERRRDCFGAKLDMEHFCLHNFTIYIHLQLVFHLVLMFMCC